MIAGEQAGKQMALVCKDMQGQNWVVAAHRGACNEGDDK